MLNNNYAECWIRIWMLNNSAIMLNVEYESKGDRNKTLSIEEYLNKIRQYIKDIIHDLVKSDTWKFQLTKQLILFLWRKWWRACNAFKEWYNKICDLWQRRWSYWRIFQLTYFLIDIKLDWKYQWDVVIISLIVFIYFIANIK